MPPGVRECKLKLCNKLSIRAFWLPRAFAVYPSKCCHCVPAYLVLTLKVPYSELCYPGLSRRGRCFGAGRGWEGRGWRSGVVRDGRSKARGSMVWGPVKGVRVYGKPGAPRVGAAGCKTTAAVELGWQPKIFF